MISRRLFTLGSLACGASALLPAPARAVQNQIWGAIRWDAWWGDGRDAIQGQADLWPSRWQFRAPAWAKVASADRLTFTPSQESMDCEIVAANAAGLKYWAYDYYPTKVDPDFMNGLKLHRSSEIRTKMAYCLIVQLGHWGGMDEYEAINSTIVTLAQDSFYQKVNGRPVVFLLWEAGSFATRYASKNTNVAASVTDLRNKMVAAGLATPYVALMKQADVKTMTDIGADALASYAIGPRMQNSNVDYPSYDAWVRVRWKAQLDTGANVVPTVMTGWDIRPIIEQPPSWYKAALPKSGENGFVVSGSTTEVAEQVQAGVNFIHDNPWQCPQKLGLIYSWNECSEGGNVLAPTLGDPNGALLIAVGAAVKQRREYGHSPTRIFRGPR